MLIQRAIILTGAIILAFDIQTVSCTSGRTVDLHLLHVVHTYWDIQHRGENNKIRPYMVNGEYAVVSAPVR